jgi:chaperonin GroES
MTKTKTEIEPIADRLVIQADETATESPGGIVLPDAAADKPQQGVVIATGPGRLAPNGTRLPMQTKEGDRVLFSAFTETVTIEDSKFVLVREDDLYAILHKKPA